MADIELVIKIDKNVFTRLFDNGIKDNEIAIDDICEMARALRMGKPLPKGHGDLIDKKIAYKKFYSRCLAKVATEVFAETPTIIEADKAESEE